MAHRSIIAKDVSRAATTATLASIELEHCNLSQMAQIELCHEITSAIEGYMNALIDNGYNATLLFTISNVINCHNCAHCHDGVCHDGVCHVFKREVFDNEFCHCWMSVKDMEGG